MSENNHLDGVGPPGPFIGQREGGVEEVKIIANMSWNGQFQGDDVLISLNRGTSFSEAGPQRDDVNLFGQRGQASLSQATMYDYNSKNKENKG